MAVTGDFAELAALRAKLARVGQDGLKRVSKQVAIEAQALVTDSFARGVSPDGVAWAPLKVRAGQPLRDTGRLLASLTPQDTGSGFVISTDVVYAALHQQGGTIRTKRKRALYSAKAGRFFGVSVTIPARPFLPTGDTLPASWVGPLTETIDEALEAFFGP